MKPARAAVVAALWGVVAMAGARAESPAAPAVQGLPMLGSGIGQAALAGQRGGSAAVDSAAAVLLAGTVAGNLAVDVSTGANAINGGAFAHASGVPMVIQNSGNNVLIQSSVVVTVQLK